MNRQQPLIQRQILPHQLCHNSELQGTALGLLWFSSYHTNHAQWINIHLTPLLVLLSTSQLLQCYTRISPCLLLHPSSLYFYHHFFNYMNSCRASYLKMSPKHFTMAAAALFPVCALVVTEWVAVAVHSAILSSKIPVNPRLHDRGKFIP